MLTLYVKPYCPYCARVIAVNGAIKAPLVYKDITADAAVRAELLEKGGKSQVPYLDDTDRGVSMYESGDIIDYLQTHYGNGAAPIVPEAGNVCPIE